MKARIIKKVYKVWYHWDYKKELRDLKKRFKKESFKLLISKYRYNWFI